MIRVCQITQQVGDSTTERFDLSERARLGNTHRNRFYPSNKPPAWFFFFSSFELSLMPERGEKGTAPIRGTDPESHTGGGEMNNNAAFLSPEAPASQFGSASIWLLLSIPSRVHSPRLRSALRFNAEPLEKDLSFLPRRKN